MSELAEKLISENMQTKNPLLDLGCCCLDGSEEELYQPLKDAGHLETLIFADDWQTYDPIHQIYVKRESQNPDRHRKDKRNNLHLIPNSLPSNLKHLILAGHWDSRWQLFNLDFLAELKQLQSLDLSYNHISKYQYQHNACFDKLGQLKKLGLKNTRLEGYGFLKNLTKLQELDLSDNKYEGFSGLDITSNYQDRDFSFIKNLNNLQVLNLNSYQSDTVAQTYSPLYKYAAEAPLNSLDLSNNQIKEIPSLLFKNLDQLQSLQLRNNYLKDISFLSTSTNLQRLDLSWNKVEDITVLQHLPNLQKLDISDNKIQDFAVVSCLKKLKSLKLNLSQLKDISFLAELTQLEKLDLSHNKLKDISILAAFTQLQYLNLEANPIQDINAIKQLNNLRQLDVSFDHLLYPPIWLASLKYKKGKIGDYNHLTELPKIEKIWQLLYTEDNANINLAQQLALGQGWTNENFEMYKNLL